MTHRFNMALAVLALTSSALAGAEALPKEGTFESKLCFSGPFTRLAVGDTDRYGTYAVTGTTQSDNKAFDALKTECVAAYEMHAGVWQHRGYCVFQDPSGDKFHGSDSLTPDGSYKVVYHGGTGKFTGFSGEATVRMIEDPAKPAPGTIQGCRQITARYMTPAAWPMP